MANVYTSNASLPTVTKTYQIDQDYDNAFGAFNEAIAKLEGQTGVVAIAVNSNTIDMKGRRVAALQMLSAGSIATIVNAIVGVPFTLLAQSTGSFGLCDVDPFRLNANWFPTTQDTLMLIWTGAHYYEIARSAN